MDTSLHKISHSNKMPVLFIGSGISKRYLWKYPNWNELLKLSFSQFCKDDFQFQKYVDTFKRQGFSDFEINTALGTVIEKEYNSAFYDRKIKLKVGNIRNPSWVKRGISPYKMFLANYFKKMKLNRNPELLKELEEFKKLKNKISAVITTNYDLFLEKYIFPDDYTVFTRQHELFSKDSYNIAEIYKIHGSANDANTIMITEKDYDEFNESRKLFIAKLLILFSESPIIFMGYSFTDEDIQSIITDFLSCLTSDELENIEEHFIFISYKENQENLNEINRVITTKNGNDIPITEIATDNFLEVFKILNEITPGISPKKIRETKKIVKKIVDESASSPEAKSIIVGIDDLDQLDLSNKPLAVAIGYKESVLSSVGYGMLSDNQIFEDILYDNKNFNPTEMCMSRFKSIPTTRLLPVYKYFSKSEITPSEGSHLRKYIENHNSIDKIYSRNISKTLKKVPELSEIKDILEEMDKEENINKKSGIVLKNHAVLSSADLRFLCRCLFELDTTDTKDELMKSTNFKRCVMILDFLENAEKD